MRISSYRLATIGSLVWIVFWTVLYIFLSSMETEAQNKTIDERGTFDTGKKIQITSDQLISNTTDNNAEFIGNVRVQQGETRIDADRLQLFFNNASGSEDPSLKQSLERLVASGNVKIIVDNRLAVANKAVYITKKRLLTLTGPGAKITSGENTISGQTITFFRDTGRFTVEGGSSGRVEAVILPTENGLE